MSQPSALPATTPSDTPPPKWWESAALIGPFTPTGEGGNDGMVRNAAREIVADCFGFEARANVIAALLNSVSPSEGSAPDPPTDFPEPDGSFVPCADCGARLEPGEAKVFTCCEACWDRHYGRKAPPSAPDTKHHACKCKAVSACGIFVHPDSDVQSALNRLVELATAYDERTGSHTTIEVASDRADGGGFHSLTQNVDSAPDTKPDEVPAGVRVFRSSDSPILAEGDRALLPAVRRGDVATDDFHRASVFGAVKRLESEIAAWGDSRELGIRRQLPIGSLIGSLLRTCEVIATSCPPEGEDTKRLDWLERCTRDAIGIAKGEYDDLRVIEARHHNDVPEGEAWFTAIGALIGKPHGGSHRTGEGKTIRAAIDSARAAIPPQKRGQE